MLKWLKKILVKKLEKKRVVHGFLSGFEGRTVGEVRQILIEEIEEEGEKNKDIS